VVAAVIAAEPKEITMTKAKSTRNTTTRLIGNQTKGHHGKVRPPARKVIKLKRSTRSADDTRAQSSAKQEGNANSKQSRVIAMLRAPGGTTIEAIARAMEWQPHSVRGFLAGVVRKKLGLNLVSAASESGRIYRINEQKPSAGLAAKSVNAA
jgi:hypothetical protein